MNSAELEVFTNGFVDDMIAILKDKGPAYSGATNGQRDRLANFKRTAERLHMSPLLVWAVFVLKHFDSVCTYATDGVETTESIRGRFLDISNYALLGAALVEETQNERQRDAQPMAQHTQPTLDGKNMLGGQAIPQSMGQLGGFGAVGGFHG